MNKQLKGSLLLLGCTAIWGSAFVAQSVGMEFIGPFTFQACRSVLAVLALLVVIYLMDRRAGRDFRKSWKDPNLWKAGFFCGLALFGASSFQQIGLVYTEPGKAGFITAMYIVLVPVFSLFLHEKNNWKIWLSVVLAVIGLYLLSCMGGISAINIGDLYMLLGAATFAVHILVIDRKGRNVDGVRLNCIQFGITAILSAGMMLVTETPSVEAVRSCMFPLFYAGVLSSAVAYSLQIIGQQYLSSAKASLLMSTESVFAVLSGWLVLHQSLAPHELMGCGLVFCAVLLAQK